MSNHLNYYLDDGVVKKFVDVCCLAHQEATNRFQRRVADRHCSCRGICGCRNKVKSNG